MAGFLRKKTKTKSHPSPPTITAPQALGAFAPPPAPLFARFATQPVSQDARYQPRLVSSPMVLSSPTRRESQQVHSGRSGNGAGAKWAEAPSRDVREGQGHHQRRDSVQQTQSQRAYDPTPDFGNSRTQAQPQFSPIRTPSQHPPPMNGRPISRVSIDKPLPPPAVVEQAPRTPPVSPPLSNRRNDGRGGPPTSHASRPQERPRTLSLQEKPLPAPVHSRQSQVVAPVLRHGNTSDTALPDISRRFSTASNSTPPNVYSNRPITQSVRLNEAVNTPSRVNRTSQPTPPTSFSHQPSSSSVIPDFPPQQAFSPRNSIRSVPHQGQHHPHESLSQVAYTPAGPPNPRHGSAYPNGNQRNGDTPPAMYHRAQSSPPSPPPAPLDDRRRSKIATSSPNGIVMRNGSTQYQVQSSTTLVPTRTASPTKGRTLTKVRPKDLAAHASQKASPPPPVTPRNNQTPSPERRTSVYSSIQPHPVHTHPAQTPNYGMAVDVGSPTYRETSASPVSPNQYSRTIPALSRASPPTPQQYREPQQYHDPQQHQEAYRSSPSPPHKSPSMRVMNSPVRGKPRIFAAMAAADQDDGSPVQQDQYDHPGGGWVQHPPAQMAGYPSPPSEFSPPIQRRELPRQPSHGRFPPIEGFRPMPQPPQQPQVQQQPTQHGHQPSQRHRKGSSARSPTYVPQPPPPEMYTPRMDTHPPFTQPIEQLITPQQPSAKNRVNTPFHTPIQAVPDLPKGHSPPNTHSGVETRSVAPPIQEVTPQALVSAIDLSASVVQKTGFSLLDEDPFAKTEGVRMMRPTSREGLSKEASQKRPSTRDGDQSGPSSKGELTGDEGSTTLIEEGSENEEVEREEGPPPSPSSPEAYRQARSQRRGGKLEAPPPEVAEVVVREDRPPEPFPLLLFLADPLLLSSLLAYLSFYEWCVLSSTSREIRATLVKTPELREKVLERFLKTVGYSRWIWDDPEPLSLSLQDLHDYMRGVSTPTHEYARVADMYVHSLSIHPSHRDPALYETVRSYTASTRAYTRVVLRLRAQAEKEASVQTSYQRAKAGYAPSGRGAASRVSSRAPSPTRSTFSHGNPSPQPPPPLPVLQSTFRSPLFRLRRAPLLRVFVPSPDGDWLSDKSVLECEAECKRAGVTHLLRMGDVVWDVAVGDEGNVGRLVWDGMYLIDLDYTYTPGGDLPKYLPTLAFPPSYFHRVIRTGATNTNPVAHIDISPWGEEIAVNLQLIQDRVRTETPQGAYHNVVRWVHRSSFVIRPPTKPRRYSQTNSRGSYRIPIPDSNLFVDSGWYGTIMVETEGTNEALADLQERCGPGAFPPRSYQPMNQKAKEMRKVFRVLREKSRPGEIWIKAVGVKERLL